MTNDFKLLREWAINYIKNKDIANKKIKNIKIENYGFLVEYKGKTHKFIINPEDISLNNVKKEEFISFVLFNTKKNLDIIINKWKDLINYEKLSIYFVNLNNNQRWILHPYTHHKICEEKKLKNGLIALFDSIEEYKGSTDKT